MTNPHYLLSIIIALYNNENYIIDCLSSLSSQLDDDIELIIVNDGSTDQSERKVVTYLEENKKINVRLVSQINHGAAHAKNTGLKISQGTFVTFVDSDDLVSNQYIQTIKPLLQSNQYDLIDFNYQKFDTSLPEETLFSSIKKTPYDFENKDLYSLIPVFEKSLWHLVTRVYRRSMLEGDQLEDGRRYEDVIFTPFQYFKTRRIAHLDHTLYFYRDNSQGITRNIKAKDIEDMVFAMQKMLRFVDAHRGDEHLRQLAALMLANCFSEMKAMSKAVYGYYRYPPETLAILRQTAALCSNSDVPHKKVRQMRFARVDSCLSKIRRWLKKHTG